MACGPWQSRSEATRAMTILAAPRHRDCTMIEKKLLDPMIANCWILIQQFAIIGSNSSFSTMVQSKCQGVAWVAIALLARVRLCRFALAAGLGWSSCESMPTAPDPMMYTIQLHMQAACIHDVLADMLSALMHNMFEVHAVYIARCMHMNSLMTTRLGALGLALGCEVSPTASDFSISPCGVSEAFLRNPSRRCGTVPSHPGWRMLFASSGCSLLMYSTACVHQPNSASTLFRAVHNCIFE